MAIPVAPTLITLVSEALAKAGQSSPDSALTIRAQNQWMEEIKNDIFLASVKAQKKLKSLFQTTFSVCTVGVHRYALPTDYAGDLTMSLLNGDITGVLASATANSVTFPSINRITKEIAVGKYLLIISGTGMGSCSQISAYNEVTFVASVTPSFTTTPAAGSGFRLITEHIYLPPTDTLQIDMLRNPTILGRPTTYATLGDQDFGEFFFDFVPDATYGIQLRYYVDLSLTSLAGVRISTLYRKWRNVFIAGVYAKALAELDDAKADKAKAIYFEYLTLLINNETSGQDLGEVQIQLER